MTAPTNMPQHRGETARNAGFSLYPWEIAEIRKFAEQHAGGDVSSLVRRAMASIGCPLDPALTAAKPAGPLVGLARNYAPAEVAPLTEHLSDVDQAALLARWLRECTEVLSLGVPVEAVHFAGEHEISAAPIALPARRYIPRLPRARWVRDSVAVYPELQPRNLSANEDPAPVRHRVPRE